jgi:hypothetical protein
LSNALGSVNATSSYVDADKVFNVKAYSAVGNGIQFSDGAITTGTTAFTSASATFTASDVGKVITIEDAGGTDINLTTTIAAFVSATAVTLTAAASATVSSKTFVYGSDDTTYIQAAIDAAAADGGGTVFFPKGIYVINGAFSNPSTDNSVLHLPSIDVGGTVQPISIKFKGVIQGYLNYGASQKNGSVLMFTTTGGSAGMNFIGVYGGASMINTRHFSAIYAKFEDLIIRTIQNPVNNVVNLDLANQVEMENVLIEPAYNPGGSYTGISMATNSSSYALITPGSSNHAVANFRNVIVFNYYNFPSHLSNKSLAFLASI